MAQLSPMHFAESPEAELVKEIEALIRKMAAGRASVRDEQRLQELQMRRIEMMRPKRTSIIRGR
ncbi:hypothetical protein QWJ07_34890 [Frankia sp. RB7]|nr:hypothetical protein [Frankia sp. RB7]